MTRLPAVALLVALALTGCAPQPGTTPRTTPAPTSTTSQATAPADVDTTTVTAAPPSRLAQLTVDDRPAVGVPYRRDLYPHWLDPDGNGCDAREDALIAASAPPARTGPGCRVLTGHWVSAYDGVEFTDPSKLDVDHVVPLAEVHRSGGAAWETGRRAQVANDPANLWAVSASSNRSKGDSDPASWTPPRRDVWCTYATRWVQIKVTYGLTADIRERDALGAMLDTCPQEG